MKKQWEQPALTELSVGMTEQYTNSTGSDYLSGTLIGDILQVGSVNTGNGVVGNP